MKKILIILFITITLNADKNENQRIIALSPSINEIIFALGAGDKIVANTDYALFPKESIELPKVGGYFSPSLEKIVALKPSLVIMQRNNHKLSLKLERVGIKTKVIEIDKLKNIKKAIIDLGNILNKTKEAEKIVEEIEVELKNLHNIVHNKKILIVFGRNTDLSKHIFVAGQNLYFDEIINESNNTNALQSKRKGQPILNMENIIAANPDIVLLLARCDADSISNEELIKLWKELPISASKKDAIYINNHIYASMPSDRLVLFLKDFHELLKDYKSKIEDNNVTDK
jgi:iron complex transport system substrate-binding protein